jgi:Spy/CpxP family protein refolding chaperone
VNNWKVILATMVIFGTGVVTGGLLVHYAEGGSARVQAPGAARLAQPATPQMLRVEFLRRMGQELKLTAEQREQVDKIIKESQQRSRKIVEPVAPQLREELQRTKEEFRKLLTPEQNTRFEELLKLQQRPREPRRPAAPAPVPTNAPASAPAERPADTKP